MNLVDTIVNKVQKSQYFPVTISNKDFPLIQESAIIAQTLETKGYRVETFADVSNGTYGFKVYQ